MNKKELRSKNVGNGRNAYDCVLDELNVMQRLEHPNIIWLHEIIDDPKKDSIFLVTEYHSNGSLGDKLKSLNEGRSDSDPKIGLKRDSVRLYLIDIIKALNYCHKIIKVIHRDIKPDNIMVNHNDEAILIDFGVSALFDGQDDQMSHNMGTQFFFAPEMFEVKKEGGTKVIRGELTDIWALGITVFQLITGSLPYKGVKNVFQLRDVVLFGEMDFSVVKNDKVRDCLKHMLQKDPAKRATLNDISTCAWLTNDGTETIDLEATIIAGKHRELELASNHSSFGACTPHS